MSVVLAFALLLLQQTPAPTVPQASPPASPVVVAAATAPADPGDEIVCRREHVVGSNRPKRICAPRRQWDQARDNAREAVQNSNSREAPQVLPSM